MANYNQNSKLSQQDKDAAKEQFRAKNPMTAPKPKMQPYDQDPTVNSQAIKKQTGNSFQRAKGIMSKAIAKYRSRPKPKDVQVDTSDLDSKEKTLVAGGKDPKEMAAMKQSIINRRRFYSEE
jgi:hypothetical protein